MAEPEAEDRRARQGRQERHGQLEAETHPANIGESVQIQGELSGREDITIEGRVDGKITMQDCSVTVGPTGQVTAEIQAHSVVVEGEVVGNIKATDRVEVAATGSLEGDISAARVVLADGACFKGAVEMTQEPKPKKKKKQREPEEFQESAQFEEPEQFEEPAQWGGDPNENAFSDGADDVLTSMMADAKDDKKES